MKLLIVVIMLGMPAGLCAEELTSFAGLSEFVGSPLASAEISARIEDGLLTLEGRDLRRWKRRLRIEVKKMEALFVREAPGTTFEGYVVQKVWVKIDPNTFVMTKLKIYFRHSGVPMRLMFKLRRVLGAERIFNTRDYETDGLMITLSSFNGDNSMTVTVKE